MAQIGSKTPEALYIWPKAVSALYIGTKKGFILIWEAVSNCIAGGWWQHGHGWDYGTGWGVNCK